MVNHGLINEEGLVGWCAHRVIQVKAHILVRTGSGELRQVLQGEQRRPVEFLHPHIVQILVAQRGVAGQHLAQHNHLEGSKHTCSSHYSHGRI